MTDHKTSTAQTGGQWNFAGILYQLLVTLRAGADAAISEVREGNDVLGVRVIVEPHMGGDSQTLTTVRRLVDQIKIRRGQKPWTARGIIENVLSDLFKARDPAGMPTSFRFVTDNLEGTDKLGAFLGEVHTAQKNGQGPETLDSSARSFRWGNERIAAATLFERTAAQLSPRDSREVWEFLGAVEIVGWSEIVSLGTVDALIGEMVDDRADVRGKRQALCTALLQLGTAGESIDLRALFAGVGLDPDKLTYARDLPAALLAQVREEASFRKYDRAMDVRSAPTLPLVPFSLLSGDSGQGKTWRLCQAALNLGEQGRCAILLPATGTIREIEDGIVALVWRDRFGGTASLGRISELLRPKLADEAGVWLTVYLDDLADAGLANAVARMPWARWGVRVVVTAQNRISQLLAQTIHPLSEIPVPDFTLRELREYLRRAGRDPHFLPDDVLLSLLRPVLASIYCRIPESASWTAVNEYALMEEYWRWATTLYRDQPLHLSDGGAVMGLAGTLLDGPAIYPWTTNVAARRNFDGATRDRLLTNGILREDAEGALEMAHSRLLNWVVALEIARRFLEGELDLASVAAQLERIDDIATPRGDTIGRRLGYVLHDLFWMLARRAKPEEVGALALLVIRKGAASSDHEHFFTVGLGSLGAPVLPALAWMARQRYSEEEWLLLRYIAAALIAVGEDAPDDVATVAEALVRDSCEQGLEVGLRVMRRIAAPAALDRLWELNKARGAALEAAKGDNNWSQRRIDKDQSFAALGCAVAARPGWLAQQAAAASDPEDVSQVIWLLIGLDLPVARPIWDANKARLLDLAPADGNAAPRAIRLFVDRDEIPRVKTALLTASDHLAALWFDALARLAPDAAVDALDRLKPRDLRGTSHWWLPGLAHRTGASVQAKLLATVGAEPLEGDPVLMDLTFVYQGVPDLLDAATFDRLVDNYEECLEADSAGTSDGTKTRRHLRALIASASPPALLDRLSARASERFEELLTNRAAARSGRSTMLRDSDGVEYRQILAAIGGSGYDALVLAELDRPNEHARTDGVTAALWTQNAEVRTRLQAIAADTDRDTYRQVQLMESLAAHHADEGLTAMIRSGSPLFVRAVDIRENGPPWAEEDIAKVTSLLGDPNPAERLVGINLCAFLPEEIAGDLLTPVLGDPSMPEEAVSLAIGVMAQHGHYRPEFLARIKPRLDRGDKGDFAAHYLAWSGDEQARAAVVDWLDGHELKQLSSSALPIAFRLLAFDDSAAGGRRFLKRVMERGLGFGNEGQILAALAEAGDNEAGEALQEIAYQKPRRGDASVIAAIKALAKSVPEEAQAAAERFFRRTHNRHAAALLLQIDPQAGTQVILDEYRRAPVAAQHEIGHLLRNDAPRPFFTDQLASLGSSEDGKDRLMAAELAGWLPAEEACSVLNMLAEDDVYAVERAALASLSQRRADAEAAELIARIAQQPRPRQWAWLLALIRLSDPANLCDSSDPRSIHALLDQLGDDFREEANRALTKRSKELAKAAEKLQKDRD